MEISIISIYFLIWFSVICVGLALTPSLAKYLVSRAGGCIPGKISCH